MRRSYLIAALVILLVSSLAARAGSSVPLDAETMKVALHTTTAEEEGFIDYVLALVDQGTLPLDMVESTFLWAKKKPRNKFQYFKRGLILRAAKAGITL